MYSAHALRWILVVPSSIVLAISLAAGEAAIVLGGTNVWTTNGPGEGAIIALAIDPSTPTTLYTGTSYVVSSGGGVYKSTDGGGDWTPMNKGLPTDTAISALAIDPSTPTTLYAGAGHGEGYGVFKSTDGGESWTAMSDGFTFEADISVLAIDPNTPTTLYAGTGYSTVGVVFKSSNGAESWTEAFFPSSLEDITTLLIDPNTPATLYVGVGYSGVFKSTDSGESWAPVNSGLPTVDCPTPGLCRTDANVRALAIDPITPSTLYAGVRGAPTSFGCSDAGVFKTTDGGGTWTRKNGPFRQVTALAIDPHASGTVYVGAGDFCWDGDGVFKSTDGGESWAPLNAGLGEGSLLVHALAIDPIDPATLYSGMYIDAELYHGVFRIDQKAVTPTHTLSPSPTRTATPRPVIIRVGTAFGLPATDVSFTVSLETFGATVAATANEIVFDTDLFTIDPSSCQLARDIEKSLVASVVYVDEYETVIRVFVQSAENNEPIRDGSLYTCRLGIRPSVQPSTYSLAIENVRAFSAGGSDIQNVHGIDGTVRVSLVPRPCPGDCDFSGDVGVDELVLSARIALGTTPLFMCEALDVQGDGTASIDDLVAAVGSSLNGCAE